jgi:hypothetical protein
MNRKRLGKFDYVINFKGNVIKLILRLKVSH